MEFPKQCFYLTNNGARLDSDGDLRSVGPGSRVLMTGRLGGRARPVIPGEWKCAVCSAMGCWPTRKTCYRCGSQRSETALAQPGPCVNGFQGNFREQNALGRPTPPTPVVVPPRLREERRGSKPPPLCFSSGAKDLEGLLQALIGIGLDENMVKQKRDQLPTPPPFGKEEGEALG